MTIVENVVLVETYLLNLKSLFMQDRRDKKRSSQNHFRLLQAKRIAFLNVIPTRSYKKRFQKRSKQTQVSAMTIAFFLKIVPMRN